MRLFQMNKRSARWEFWIDEYNRLCRREPLSPIALLILTSWYFELEREILREER